MYTRKKVRQGKKRMLLVLELILIISFLCLLVILVHRLSATRRIADEENSAGTMYEHIATELEESQSNTALEHGSVQPEIKELMEQNSDAVGLLHFDGDRTLYVCQTIDKRYYMTHRFDKSEDPAGMIYMDYRNSLWPRSENLILYGHNMRDGSRFGTLKRFENVDHMVEHPIFQLVERYETVDYIPIAIFHTTAVPDDSNYYAFDRINFADENDFNQYIRDVKSRSIIDIPASAVYGDKLLTLATCYSGQEHGRLVIVCREVIN